MLGLDPLTPLLESKYQLSLWVFSLISRTRQLVKFKQSNENRLHLKGVNHMHKLAKCSVVASILLAAQAQAIPTYVQSKNGELINRPVAMDKTIAADQTMEVDQSVANSNDAAAKILVSWSAGCNVLMNSPDSHMINDPMARWYYGCN